MPIDVAPPKYAMIVNALQDRIANEVYPVGSMLPSEATLTTEFSVSRPTVVRALEYLRQAGWIEGQQGKGRYVLGPPPTVHRRPPSYADALLNVSEPASVKLLDVGAVPAPPRAASVLQLAPGTMVVARRRLVVSPGVGPVELSTAFVPKELATGTEIVMPRPLSTGLLRHLADRKGVEVGRATERISARLPSPEEANLLEISRRDCLLTVLLGVTDRVGQPVVAVDVVMPSLRHELEDEFSLL